MCASLVSALAAYGSALRNRTILQRACAGSTLLVGTVLGLKLFGGAARDELAIFFVGLVGAAAASIVPIFILRWVGRREREHWFVYAIALLWGGLIAAAIAVVLPPGQDALSGGTTNYGAAPLIEETVKALALIALLFALRGEFDDPRNGFIYGALIGLGFTGFEGAIHLAKEFQATGVAPWGEQFASRYALLGFGGHALFGAITGTFIGFGFLHSSNLVRVLFALTGFSLAALLHLLLDVSAQLWSGSSADTGAILGVNFFGIAIVVIGLRYSGRWERAVMADQLADEVGSPSVTVLEYVNIRDDAEPPEDPKGRQIFRAQCRLAKRKAYLARRRCAADDDPAVKAWREELEALRGA